MEIKITVKGIKKMLINEMYIFIRYDMRDDKFYLVEWDENFQYEKVIQEISEKEWDTIREEYPLIDVRKERGLGKYKWGYYWK